MTVSRDIWGIIEEREAKDGMRKLLSQCTDPQRKSWGAWDDEYQAEEFISWSCHMGADSFATKWVDRRTH